MAADEAVVVGGLGLMGVEVMEFPLELLGRSSSGLLLRCTAAFKAESGEGKPKSRNYNKWHFWVIFGDLL